MSALLALRTIFTLDLVFYVVNLTRALFLLTEQATHKVGHFHFETLLTIVLQLAKHMAEVIRVLQSRDFHAAHVFLLFPLFHTHERDVLLESHQFALNAFENLVQELRGGITLAADLIAIVIGYG